MAIVPPVKVGEPRVLATRFGKSLLEQDYRHPSTGEVYAYAMWHAESCSAIIFPLTSDLKVVAVRQFRHAAGEVITEIPGGNAKPGQSQEDAVHAELREEGGHRPGQITRPIPTTVFFEPANLTPPFDPILATHCVQTSQGQLDKYEYSEPAVFPLREWIALIMDGGVRDSKSIAMTFLGLLHLGLIELKPAVR